MDMRIVNFSQFLCAVLGLGSVVSVAALAQDAVQITNSDPFEVEGSYRSAIVQCETDARLAAYLLVLSNRFAEAQVRALRVEQSKIDALIASGKERTVGKFTCDNLDMSEIKKAFEGRDVDVEPLLGSPPPLPPEPMRSPAGA